MPSDHFMEVRVALAVIYDALVAFDSIKAFVVTTAFAAFVAFVAFTTIIVIVRAIAIIAINPIHPYSN